MAKISASKELKKLLADTYALQLKTQNYHWNVEGVHFHDLHKLFEEQYNEIAAAVDEIAERIRALDEYAPGSFSAFSKLTSIGEPVAPGSHAKMLDDLIKSHQEIAKQIYLAAKAAEKASDLVTGDMMVARAQAHEKHIWMLKSTAKK